MDFGSRDQEPKVTPEKCEQVKQMFLVNEKLKYVHIIWIITDKMKTIHFNSDIFFINLL